MQRISERNKFPQLDLCHEYYMLESKISQEELFAYRNPRGVNRHFTIEDYVEEFCFKGWELRGAFWSVEEMRKGLGLEKRLIEIDIEEDFILDFLQYALNIIMRAKYVADRSRLFVYETQEIQFLIENIEALADKLNTHFEADEDTGELFLLYNDELSDVVAQDNFELKHSLVEYKKTVNRGNLERKAEILCTLSKRLEDEGKKLGATEFRSLYADTTFLLNNAGIRHCMTKDSKSRTHFGTMDSQELEMWYDKAYEMLLSCLVVCPYIGIKQEIKKLKDASK